MDFRQTHNGFRPFQSNTSYNRTCYDDDISNAMSTKTDNELSGWLFNTRRMAANLLISADPSKGDPVALSEKLEKRADQMEAELRKREAYKVAPIPKVRISAMPIKKHTPIERGKSEWQKSIEAIKREQQPNWKVTTHEEEEEKDSLLCSETDALEGSPTLTQRIEHEGKIFIE